MANRTGSSWISVVVAVVCVVGFFGWLSTQERVEPVAVAEPADSEAPAANAGDAGGPATLVEPDSLTKTAFVRGMQGQEIELRSVPVSMAMGSNFIWVDLPNGQSFLVKLDSTSVASGAPAPTGNVHVIGRLAAKDNALLDQWRQAGVLESDDHRTQAEFGSSYIDARRVQPAGN